MPSRHRNRRLHSRCTLLMCTNIVVMVRQYWPPRVSGPKSAPHFSKSSRSKFAVIRVSRNASAPVINILWSSIAKNTTELAMIRAPVTENHLKRRETEWEGSGNSEVPEEGNAASGWAESINVVRSIRRAQMHQEIAVHASPSSDASADGPGL